MAAKSRSFSASFLPTKSGYAPFLAEWPVDSLTLYFITLTFNLLRPAHWEHLNMDHSQLSEVQATNLRTLMAVRLGLEQDATDTCRAYALCPRAAERLRLLSVEGIWALVHAVGQVSLFIARDDLAALVDAPPAVAGALAAAHPPRPAVPQPSR